MIDTPLVGEQTTSHSDMLNNCREALSTLLADQQTQQNSCDAIHTIIAGQNAMLEENQQRRSDLLAAQAAAQLASNKAQAAADLARGTPSEQEREVAYEQARDAVSAIQREMLDLAAADARVREEMQRTQSLLEDANEALARISERVAIAESIYAEVESLHREEIKSVWMGKLTAARRERDAFRAQTAEKETLAQSIQVDMASSISQWPEYARSVLNEVLEIPDDEGTSILQMHLNYVNYVEEHASGFDPTFAKLLTTAQPDVVYLRNYGSRSIQRGGMSQQQLIAQGRGRGISPDLWHFDTAMAELEQVCQQSRAENRRRTVEQLLGNAQEVQQSTRWTEANRTL